MTLPERINAELEHERSIIRRIIEEAAAREPGIFRASEAAAPADAPARRREAGPAPDYAPTWMR